MNLEKLKNNKNLDSPQRTQSKEIIKLYKLCR